MFTAQMAMDSNHKISMNGCRCNCMVTAGRNYQWGRSVKRKREDAGFEPRGDSSDAEVGREEEDDLMTLRETLRSQHQALEKLASELEEERNASAIAATETMSMILRLQKEKAEVQMEASQFRRFAEGRFAHDQQELTDLENLLYRKDQVIQALECEVQSYKHRLLSIGFAEFENERIRSPEGFQPDYREDCFSSWDCCGSRSPFAGKLDGFDSNDGEVRDSSQKQDKEPMGGNICLDKPNEAAISRQPQQQWEDSFYLGIMRGRDTGYGTCHGLQSEEYSPTCQEKDCNLKVRQGYNNSETDDAQNIAIKAIEKSLADDSLTLWKCIEKLDDRLQMLEKMAPNHHLDNEWIATRKVLQKKLASYSASLREGTIFYQRLSTNGTDMSNGTRGEADEDNLGEINFLSSINVKGPVSEVCKINADISCPGKAAAMLAPVDGIAEQKSTLNGAFEAENDNASTRGCKPLKGNRDWMKEPVSPPKRHEGDKSGRAPDLTERKGERNTTLVNDPGFLLHHDSQMSRTDHGVDNSAVLPMDLDNEQTATKRVFKKNLTAYSSSSREGLKSHQRLSTESTGISFGMREVDNGSSENYDGLPSANFKGNRMPELSNTRVNLSCSGNKATAALPVDDVANRKSNANDVFENQSSNSSSRGFKLLKGGRHEGETVFRATDLTERKTGGNTIQANEQETSLSMKLKAEPAADEDELRQLSLKLKELERERDSMKQAIQTLKREKAHLALLKEIAQQLHELQAPDKNQKGAKKLSLQEGVSILSIIKWILSYIFRRNKKIRQSKYMCDVSHNNVGLLFLLDNAPKKQLGMCITRLGM